MVIKLKNGNSLVRVSALTTDKGNWYVIRYDKNNHHKFTRKRIVLSSIVGIGAFNKSVVKHA